MDAIKRKTTVVGVVTLIIGLVVGLGIGAWGIKTSHAGNPPSSTTQSTASNPASNGKSSAVDTEKDDSLLSNNGLDHWDPFRDMERMQEQVDRAIHDATEKFSLGPGATVFRPDAGYSSSFDLRDRKDHYEVRAYLPDVNASDVNVKVRNDRTLDVSVKQHKQETGNTSGGTATYTELGEYEQVITLPEAVKADQVKVNRNGHEIVITIPKLNPTA
jgi:HSP20 family molecular chaperone IbpA